MDNGHILWWLSILLLKEITDNLWPRDDICDDLIFTVSEFCNSVEIEALDDKRDNDKHWESLAFCHDSEPNFRNRIRIVLIYFFLYVQYDNIYNQNL